MTGGHCCAGTGGQAHETTNICKCLAKIAPVVAGGPFVNLRPSPLGETTDGTTTDVQGCTGAELEPYVCQIRVQHGTNTCKRLAKIAPVVVGGPFNNLRPSSLSGTTDGTNTNVQGCTDAESEPYGCQIRVQHGVLAGLSAATAAKVGGPLHRRDEPECGVRLCPSMRYVFLNPAQHLVLTGGHCCAGTGGQVPGSTHNLTIHG